LENVRADVWGNLSGEYLGELSGEAIFQWYECSGMGNVTERDVCIPIQDYWALCVLVLPRLAHRQTAFDQIYCWHSQLSWKLTQCVVSPSHHFCRWRINCKIFTAYPPGFPLAIQTQLTCAKHKRGIGWREKFSNDDWL